VGEGNNFRSPLGADRWPCGDNTCVGGHEVAGITRRSRGVADGTEAKRCGETSRSSARWHASSTAIGNHSWATWRRVDNAAVYDDAGKGQHDLAGPGTTISNLGGTNATDAVNFSQLSSVASIFGGGATFDANGMLTGAELHRPGRQLRQHRVYVQRIDNVLTGIQDAAVAAAGEVQPACRSVPAMAWRSATAATRTTSTTPRSGNGSTVGSGNGTAIGSNKQFDRRHSQQRGAIGADASVTAGTTATAIGQGASVTASDAVAIGQGSVADRANTVSVGARVRAPDRHVAAGTQATDAVNLSQMQAGDQAAIRQRQGLHGHHVGRRHVQCERLYRQPPAGIGDQFAQLNQDVMESSWPAGQRIDRMGAMKRRMTNMAINAAGSRSPRGRIAVGAGWQNGESAMSIGYSKQIGERASFSLGGAFASDDQSAGIGFATTCNRSETSCGRRLIGGTRVPRTGALTDDSPDDTITPAKAGARSLEWPSAHSSFPKFPWRQNETQHSHSRHRLLAAPSSPY
jgi:hypothetical protein